MSAKAGTGSPVFCPLMTGTGVSSIPPRKSYSLMFQGMPTALAVIMPGGRPQMMATGHASPRAQYFRVMRSPCFPEIIHTPRVFWSWTCTR